MSNIVSELTERFVDWTDIIRGRGTNRVALQVEPEAIPWRACGVIADKDVVWVGDPEAGWGAVGVEQAERGFDRGNKVMLNSILGLDCILDEHSMSHSVVIHVPQDSQVVHAVNCRTAIV